MEDCVWPELTVRVMPETLSILLSRPVPQPHLGRDGCEEFLQAVYDLGVPCAYWRELVARQHETMRPGPLANLRTEIVVVQSRDTGTQSGARPQDDLLLRQRPAACSCWPPAIRRFSSSTERIIDR